MTSPANADYVIKAHDLLPTFRARLASKLDPTKSVDLTNALSIRFIMKVTDGAIKLNVPATFVDRINGVVEYAWVAGDTDATGNFLAEWQVTWPGGKPQTFPTTSYHTIAIVADLDGV